MPAAPAAVNLGPRHEETAVGRRFHCAVQRLPEAWPSASAVELGLRGEERQPAARAPENALPMLIVERAGPCALGTMLAQHPKLLGIQRAPPLGLVLLDPLGRGGGCIGRI